MSIVVVRPAGAFDNAGIEIHNKLIDDLDADEWDSVLDVNAKRRVPVQEARDQGHAENGRRRCRQQLVDGWHRRHRTLDRIYCSKHAVIGATRGAASEARETGVRVNAVLPGSIVTPMIEKLRNDSGFKDHFERALERHSIGRFGQPEDVGSAVKWLLSDEAAFINGAMLAVDGGYTG